MASRHTNSLDMNFDVAVKKKTHTNKKNVEEKVTRKVKGINNHV